MKTKAIRNPAHLKFIRSLPCCKCGSYGSQAAHIRKHGKGGTGIKPGDDKTLPQCHDCHEYSHVIGELSFYRSIEAAHELANALWLRSGDEEYAVTLISRKRGELF